ncbi:hypothetical protein PVAP13_5NG186400 [Panicum virgatum]|uniref:Uncharacterized protein n=1 Tax=Panicum virgatum TaxID=38727 RepID=A0A8T0RNP7_PANVG|nr:hypothetical protein PVAP13_5NG186400 [Panicum virgatum]
MPEHQSYASSAMHSRVGAAAAGMPELRELSDPCRQDLRSSGARCPRPAVPSSARRPPASWGAAEEARRRGRRCRGATNVAWCGGRGATGGMRRGYPAVRRGRRRLGVAWCHGGGAMAEEAAVGGEDATSGEAAFGGGDAMAGEAAVGGGDAMAGKAASRGAAGRRDGGGGGATGGEAASREKKKKENAPKSSDARERVHAVGKRSHGNKRIGFVAETFSFSLIVF